ncbi:MAG: DegT/DnrJ/EryC1/StrS aminotransferase family protein [Okeania sp. SIO2G4]|uniref:DegT/DnrJ/EryC1/StrS family aminotransferase n=1 Tax=unclassified Okeania TaxID=2634635 RepID=UPI0013B82592|nr:MULTISPECIES: DegT/DnrJ/EryC1/StrS family aminotransferase [unclassified Okeania]NEP75941.1 DegT/DnrJ/EryC1/StrS aminotransferase family protein [Okeania sp. SIO2G5]NEP97118.1 DegT/DnrJ/EryC1/StrS aminotransferase family protein [Okeania sp. SIO2F5]NEQ94804.1 DegT/DnrJ/EryC1/StrS aminotransferase family protein [Okeania sp. SIO2G4]
MTVNQKIKPFYFDITDDEIQYFLSESEKILRSGRLILGEHTTAFEQAFAEYVGTKYAIAVNSGSSGLEILLRLKKVEATTVLVPTNTNFATVATVIRAGGKVQYLDMDKQTFAPSLQMVQEAVEKGNNLPQKISGVMWVHIGGVISPEFPQVVEYCHQRGLFVLEDTAHAHGSKINDVSAGNLGDGAAFSFFPTKVMTTCEGGMITLNNEEEDYIARSLRNQGKRGMDFGGLHTDFGNSMRITEMNALLGRIHLAKLPEMLKKRERAYELITAPLKEAGLSFVSTEKMDIASNYKLIVHLPEGKNAKEIKTALAEEEIFLGGTVYEIPCHKQPVFAGICEGESFPGAERWCPNHICPPLTSGMTEADAQRVGEALVRHLQ